MSKSRFKKMVHTFTFQVSGMQEADLECPKQKQLLKVNQRK